MSGAIVRRNPRLLGTGVPQSAAEAVAICMEAGASACQYPGA
ncbi:MAG TPA: hypothetical protein VHR27_04330 [Blastocatellia bacterium]|nr:hypothetical protein [Blastocatellia bacterium]